ncbi:unnamed protein product [Clonostachys chloroleuca]|uniref:AB hydrolase-1 domain-containing protein n=1 Tax=Clonostachys chloroleuca TaxID=1926264 RepID=A0AA35Q9X4_9HYPO|nr:unnamed protein product [Clonostachys chloroleuca]
MPAPSDGYTTRGLPPPPAVSTTTIPMAGLLVDVYGLDELPASPSAPVTCLWLLHPRTRTRGRMHDIAARTVKAWHGSPEAGKRGLVALCFDMPNHGTRVVSERANGAWAAGNDTHAIDMLGMVKGARADMSGLMDVVAGYLGRENVDGHVVLGWSLGGHAAWQAWLGEERVDAAVSVIGSPDFMGLMGGRAAGSKLDCGAQFLGSRFFPRDLVAVCKANDPKGFLFSDSPLPQLPLSEAERSRLSALVDSRGLRSKKLLLLSGGDDQLVPHKFTAPFVKVLAEVGGLQVDDRVFDGVGHWFSAEMVEQAVEFLVKAVGEGPRPKI